LREYNNPLPRWWLWLFVITVLFGIGYLVLYPGLGTFGGTLGWSQLKQHSAESAANEARISATLAPFAGRTPVDLSNDRVALGIGRNLFANNCAACHGADGRGAPGFPNLADGDWLWGGTPERIIESISAGRNGVMAPWGEVLGPSGVEDMVAYVMSLSGRSLPAGNAANGRAKFGEICIACHGADGRGNQDLGAPNLTDGIWLHGGSIASLRQTIAQGRQNAMPAHLEQLGDVRVNLLAAYVLSLSRDAAAPERQAAIDVGTRRER
jgi:cytochrome c oxidase cbb3-type subunit 3